MLNDNELKAIWAATADANDYSAVRPDAEGQRAAEIAGLRGSIAGDRLCCRLSAPRTPSACRPSPTPCAPSSRSPRRTGRDLISVATGMRHCAAGALGRRSIAPRHGGGPWCITIAAPALPPGELDSATRFRC